MRFLVPWLLLAAAGWAADAPEPGTMSLPDAVRYALGHSPELKSSDAEVARRQGLATTQHSLLMPRVDLEADADRSRYLHGYPGGTTPALLRFDTALYTGSANLRYLAWDFHKTELELAAVKERVEAGRADADRRKQEVVFDTARLYLETLTYQDLIGAAEARIGSLRSLLKRTNELVKAGRAVPVDAMKIQTQLAGVESDLATLEAGQRSSLSALAAVMGYEGDLPRLEYKPAAAAAPAEKGPEGELLKEAVGNRPELAASGHEILAEEKTVESVKKSALPSVELTASAIEYGAYSPVGFPQLIGKLIPGLPLHVPTQGSGATDWVLGARVTFPLFDGGRRKGEMQTAEAALEQARQARRQAELRVSREVRTAMADLDSAEGRVRALRDSVAESERVLHDERVKYEAGRSVINFVLEAEAGLLNNESLLDQAERSVSIARLSLDLATGRIGDGAAIR